MRSFSDADCSILHMSRSCRTSQALHRLHNRSITQPGQACAFRNVLFERLNSHLHEMLRHLTVPQVQRFAECGASFKFRDVICSHAGCLFGMLSMILGKECAYVPNQKLRLLHSSKVPASQVMFKS